MPTFSFRCKKCHHEYEEITSYDSTGKYKKIKCPECESKSKENLIGWTGGLTFGNPVGTDKWTSDGNGHDYRYKWNKPRIAAQRAFAEKNSHVGANPYAVRGDRTKNDIESGKYFGPAK